MQLRLCALLVFLTLTIEAGQPALRVYNTDDGLVRNWIERIRSDSRGYLWFCTVEGLSIFDGSHFTNFTIRDGLPNRLVNDVVERANGEYWIATDNALAKFHPIATDGKSHFEKVNVGSDPEANRVSALLEDSNHRLWLATDDGLYFESTAGGHALFSRVSLGTSRKVSITSLAEDSRHRIWAGEIGGVYLRYPDGRVTHLGKEKGIPLNVRAMAFDRDTLWVGGEGLTSIDVSADNPTVLTTEGSANGRPLRVASLFTADGELWIAGVGLIRLRPNSSAEHRFQFFPESNILGRSNVLAIGADAGSNLWFGVSTLGAVRIASSRSDIYTESDGLESGVVVGITEDRHGRIYAITGSHHELNQLAGDHFEPRPRRTPADLTDFGWGQGSIVLQDRTGRWWVGTGMGLLGYPPSENAEQLAVLQPRFYDQKDGCPPGAILRLFEDSRGDLWVGTSTGIAVRSSSTGKWTSFPSVREPVHSIVEDSAGSIWVGFAAPVLVRIRRGVMERVSSPQLHGFLNALLCDHLGRVWIGSSYGELGRIDDPAAEKPEVRNYFAEKLSCAQIFALAEDRLGRLYIAGGRGVDQINLQTGTIRHFGQETGLPRGETERLYRDSRGFIWFASNFGLARWNPAPEPSIGSAPPPPLIRGIRFGNGKYPISALGASRVGTLELRPFENNVDIDFRSIDFDVGKRLLYQHRSRGGPEPWSSPAPEESVHLGTVAPGSYSFEVRSINEEGVVSEPASFSFRLLPPIWRRWWFLTAMASVAAAAGFSLHRYRLNQALGLERLRTRLASDLHDDLGAGLAEIAILSEVGRRNWQNADKAMRQVAERARNLRSALGDIVWTVDPRKDRLPDVVQRMREAAHTLLDEELCEVHFKGPTEDSAETTELSPDLRRHLMLFFKEAVTNVARHARASRVDLSLVSRQNELILSVSDNGPGFNPLGVFSGQGLRSMRYRAGEMNARLSIQSGNETGTAIELTIPRQKRVRRLKAS